MNALASQSASRSRNWLLRRLRSWHTWAGLTAGLCLLLAGVTGIFLNHKAFFLGLAGGEQPRREKPATSPATHQKAPPLRLGTALSGQAVSFEKAVALAAARWGDPRLEKIELKEERGELTYRIKQKDGAELLINAITAEVLEKGAYEKLGPAGPDGKPQRSFDWGKLAMDLHTGKIGGAAGKLLMSATALILLTLIVSGAYLWAAPKWRQRRAARAPAVATSAGWAAHAD